MNVKEAEQLLETKEQAKKQITHKELIRRISFNISSIITVFILQLILPNLLPNLLTNGNKSSIDGAGLYKVKELMINICSICIFIIFIYISLSTAYYIYLFVRDSALVEVPISNEDSKGKIETVKIETRKKAVTGIRYKCEYCGREYLLTKHFNGFVPNCKSCGAVLEKKENINIEK